MDEDSQPEGAGRRSASSTPAIPGVRLDEVIGRGGFASVYGGVQLSMQRPVAVKVDSRPLDDDRNRRRYLREVQAAGRITGHPHVVSLIDTGVLEDSRPYIVMERCDGGSLTDLVRRNTLSANDAVPLVRAASSALGAAHAAGVLHRDVKPANILLDSYGSPRLTDFGIASIEREGQDPTVTLECLTPDFAPPEAFTMEVPSSSGDVWSMGAVLYYLLVGIGPRRAPDGSARSLAEIIRILDAPVDLTSPLIPEMIRPVLERAMAIEPSERYRNGTELADVLTELESNLGTGDMTVVGPGVAVRLARAGMASADSSSAAPSGYGIVTAAGSTGAYGVIAEASAGATPPSEAYGYLGAARPAAPQASSRQYLSTTGPATTPGWSRRLVAASAAMLTAGLLIGGALGFGVGRATASDGGAGAAMDSPTDTASPQPSATMTETTIDAVDPSTPPFEVGTCLGGTVVIAGVATASPMDCTVNHYWEVYAVGALDPSTTGYTQEEIENDPNVLATCTAEAAQAYGEPEPTVGALGPSEVQWTVEGRRGFSCLVQPPDGAMRMTSYQG